MADGEPSAEAVVFDLDGLMINTEQIYDDVGDELLRRRGKRFTPQLKDEMMGRPGSRALEIMIQWHGLNDHVDQLQAESEEIFNRLLPDRLAPMPGMLQLLDGIVNSNIPRAIATSSRRRFVDKVMALLKIEAPFSLILTAENVRHGKPDPEIYLAAADSLGIAPQKMLVLEDSEIGSRAAITAGALTVAVPGSHSRHHNFDGAVFVADSLRDPRIYHLLGLPLAEHDS